MKEKYKVFKKGFNKTLDLIEQADAGLARIYKTLINKLSQDVIDKILKWEDFYIDDDKNNIEMRIYQNRLELDYIEKTNYLRAEIELYRFFEEEIMPQQTKRGLQIKKPVRLFTLSLCNTASKNNVLQAHVEEIDGQYKYVGFNDDNKNVIDMYFDVYIDFDGEDYNLCVEKSSRGWMLDCKKENLLYEEILQSVEDEDAYEEEMEIEFTPEFDI
ncbi:MAG: hypothetical protein IKM43_03005 [Clostridia bacterium]|nr:hypothetical protein [Clostridia bacterium]